MSPQQIARQARAAGWVKSSSLLESDLAAAIRALHGPSADELNEDLNHPSLRFFNVKTKVFSSAKTWVELLLPE